MAPKFRVSEGAAIASVDIRAGEIIWQCALPQGYSSLEDLARGVLGDDSMLEYVSNVAARLPADLSARTYGAPYMYLFIF